MKKYKPVKETKDYPSDYMRKSPFDKETIKRKVRMRTPRKTSKNTKPQMYNIDIRRQARLARAQAIQKAMQDNMKKMQKTKKD